jgi:DNA-binding GntR family transcriptional regulator
MTLHQGRTSPPRLSDVVADGLREDILAGRLRPGTRLDVGELATNFGISRTPVDDGLRRLEDEGLVVIARRRGTFVAAIDERDVREVFEIRAALETLAARRAAEHRDAEAVVKLDEILERLAEAISGRNVEQHARWNAAFHEQLIRMSGNKRLLALHRSLHAQITIARVHAQSTSWTVRADLELREHQDILDAVAQGDGDRAAAAVWDHILRAAHSLTADLSQSDGTAHADR